MSSIETAPRRSKRSTAQKAKAPPAIEELEGAELRPAKRARGKKTPAPRKTKKSGANGAESEKKIEKEAPVVIDAEDEREEVVEEGSEEQQGQDLERAVPPKLRAAVAARGLKKDGGGQDGEDDLCFIGDPVPEEEAKVRWPHRYELMKPRKLAITQNGEDDDIVNAKCHYLQAKVDNVIYNLNDDAYVAAGEDEPDYIGRILEFFETYDGQLYFSARWYFRPEDTVIKELAHFHDAKRVFLSDDRNDNALNCIVKKIRIVRVTPEIGLPVNEKDIQDCDLYYDMSFSVAYSSFTTLPLDVGIDVTESASTTTTESSDLSVSKIKFTSSAAEDKSDSDSERSTAGEKIELSLLDLYSGCGAMSTGLCLGANLAGINLKTHWAVDINSYACQSLKFNHPEAEVRNEKAEDFLALLREWVILVQKYGLKDEGSCSVMDSSEEEEPEQRSKIPKGEFEVGKIVGICYGKTDNLDKEGLKYKVRWKGYGPSEDTWEPADGLSKCEERIKDFVRYGYKKNILPLPGKVDVICGGPPCQGISGFNRFRKAEKPFEDEKNKQMLVFMDVIEFLKPKFVLMENVVDILKFAKGQLGRYALSRLVTMKYQARLGILAAGNYGLPQYRMRVFLWGAEPTQKLPQFPLPTHKVVTRGSSPVEFETHVVAFERSLQKNLEEALLLADAISDLPPIENNESRDEMDYLEPSKTDFQRYIRLSQYEMMSPLSTAKKSSHKGKLFDHRPLTLNDDDYQRVCRIPKHKGANFRNLEGVMVGPNNVAQLDPNIERVLLPSGKPLVPDYAISFIDGKSSKPFGRLWWDETVPTVVTRAEPHNQTIIHPQQDRVLSIRENARLQGFPDYYRLFGPVKQRYIQVGNAVAVPVSRALGYGLGLAYLGKGDNEPVFALPQKFPINL